MQKNTSHPPPSNPIVYTISDLYYFQDIQDWAPTKFFTNAELVDLITKFQTTKDLVVRDKLIQSFMKYIISIAKSYINQGLSMGDMISEGTLGLILALENFDTTKGVKFVTFAHQVIGRYIREALDYSNYAVKLPKNIRNDRRKAITFLRKKEIEGVNIEELSETDEGIPKFVIPFLRRPQLYTKLYSEDYQEVHKMSLFDSTQEREDNVDAEPDHSLHLQDLREDLYELIESTLPENIAVVIKLLFGIDRDIPMTSYRDIGHYLNIKPSEVHELKEEGLETLKAKGETLLAKYL